MYNHTMKVIRVYIPQALTADKTLVLDKAVQHYLTRVLRLKPGHSLNVFNGQGGYFEATLQDLTTLTIGRFFPEHTQTILKLHLGQALCSQNKFDLIVQKATELGVTEITPLITEFGQTKINIDKLTRKHEHWNQIIIHACQQCGRNILPIIHPPTTLQTWQQPALPSQCSVVFHPHGTMKLSQWSTEQADVSHIKLLIGPEGGLSEQEIEQLTINHFDSVTLGPRILRMETAAIAGLAALQVLLGDLS